MNFKKLIEKRNELVEKMNQLVEQADTEVRALNEEEVNTFNELKKQVEQIDTTLNLAKEERKLIADNSKKEESVNKEELEKRAFAKYIREGSLTYYDVETRAEVNMEKGKNGAAIPKTIADKIISTVKNIAPILELSDFYDVKGDLVFPVYDETTGAIQCAYAEEFTALTANSGKFTAITLGGYVSGALAKVSRSLINNAGFDVVNYVIVKVSEAIAAFLEKEFIIGTQNKITGLTASEKVEMAASATAITADDLINTQLRVPQAFRKSGVWIMNSETFKAVSKLKDQDGRYLLNADLKNEFGYTLLNCRVYESDSMPKIEKGSTPVVFADLSGYATKIVKESFEIQLLQERFATEHAVGVIGWVEADGKIIEPQKVAVLKMA